MDQTISGIFMKNVVDEIKKAKGDKGLALLKEKIGTDSFAAFKTYPMEMDVRLAQAACEILYGDHSPASYNKLGRLTFSKYTESVVGKTMYALTGNDFNKAIQALGQVFETFSSGISIKAEQISDQQYTIVTEHNPYNIHHYEGIWLAALAHYGYNGTIESKEIDKEKYLYTITLGA